MSVNIFKNGILSKIAGAVGDAVPLINNFLTNQEGKGAADANTVYVLNNKIEELNSSLGGLSFGADGDGNYGYYGADGSLVPFKMGIDTFKIVSNYTTSFTVSNDYDFIIIYCRSKPKITRSSGQTVSYIVDDDNNYAIYVAKNVVANETFTSSSGWIQYLYPTYK